MSGLRRLCAHIIATFVPNKRVSNHVKKVIKHGIIRRIREIRDLRAQEYKTGKYKYNLAVVAIMKNEGPYLQEWIEFHKLIGVEKFYLYDNESTDETQKILKPYIKSGLVDYTPFPGQKMQLPAYNDCIEKHKNETKWLAVIDLDEFIVPVKYDTLTDFLNEQQSESIAQFIIPWIIFGSNGHKTKPDGLVIESYTKRGKHSWLYKSIINPRLVFNMSCHEHDVAGRTVSVNQSKVRCHHYHCKSWEEYKLKALRGDAWDGADAGIKKYQQQCFNRHDLNEVVDNSAVRFAPMVSRNMRK